MWKQSSDVQHLHSFYCTLEISMDIFLIEMLTFYRHETGLVRCWWYSWRFQFCNKDGWRWAVEVVHIPGMGEGNDRNQRQSTHRSYKYHQWPDIYQVTLHIHLHVDQLVMFHIGSFFKRTEVCHVIDIISLSVSTQPI